ncbi:hypothetical protein GQ44DRAFT_773185 [Phaeosphaeriaceae sp. PMI808]|nr:hypothetical protein GQ44DRAFT_773185 [Phaeosphaeriaceae sp. PMI808]
MAKHFQEERRTADDAFRAYATMALFFDTKSFLTARRIRLIAGRTAEPGRPMDLYIGYRIGMPLPNVTANLVDPTPFNRDFIIQKAHKSKEKHASAKFAVLRLWSAPHFYPITMELKETPLWSFFDDRGRCWEFKFVPKDMPHSEWKVHQQPAVTGINRPITGGSITAQSMLLHPDPGLAEVPGFSREQLDALARNVELRRQQLEKDIEQYIRHRQDELRTYGQELLAQQRQQQCSMECVEDSESAQVKSGRPAISSQQSQHSQHSQQESSATTSDPKRLDAEEKTKRTKHTRVQKREKELYGLVTPVFLPLLDARDMEINKAQKKKKKKVKDNDNNNDDDGGNGKPNASLSTTPEHATPAGDAEKHKEGSKLRREEEEEDDDNDDNDDAEMEGSILIEVVKKELPTTHTEPPKKSKRIPAKKSALRQHNTSRQRRKRVSLVIDGQTVLPADTVTEPALLSPGSEATSLSTSNSTTSLDDMIDPRLTRSPLPTQHEHQDAVHHSLPLPMSTSTMHAATKPLVETPSSITTTIPITPYVSTPSPPRVLDPNSNNNNDGAIAQPAPTSTTPPDPIFAPTDTPDHAFSTYVGGLHGSGADNLDQAGSYGYPSSLGASYLESYMQSRPLRVRMEAADKAGLDEREKCEMLAAGEGEASSVDGDGGMVERVMDDGGGDGDVDMDFMGEMEGF